MTKPTPIENANTLLEKTTPLTREDKALFGYFGVDAKILPPLRIPDPRHVFIGDVTAVRKGCHINAFKDLSFLLDQVDPKYRGGVQVKYPSHRISDRYFGRDIPIPDMQCALVEDSGK